MPTTLSKIQLPETKPKQQTVQNSTKRNCSFCDSQWLIASLKIRLFSEFVGHFD
jgi:hypothetical protein